MLQSQSQSSSSWEGHDLTPLRFERRAFDRWEGGCAATAFILASDRFGELHELDVTDLSDGGAGAISSEPICPGTVISLGFSQTGLLARRGEVTRCRPCGRGYRVGIRFAGRLAA